MFAVIGVIGLWLVAYVWSVIWSIRDAKRRNKSAPLVGLLAALTSPFGFLAWLVFRPSQPIASADPGHERQWKWILGLGIAAFIGVFLTAGGSLVGITSNIKGTMAYVEAMDRLRANPAAVEVLGEPINDNWMVSGSLAINGGSGREDVAVPVKGPKGKGTMYLKGRMSAGVWTLELLTLDTDGKLIDLLRSSNM
jgi:hypothetical protein